MRKWLLQVALALVLGVVGVLASTGRVQAADYTCNWTGGGGNTNWNTPLNWDCGTPDEVFPVGVNDIATIDKTGAIVSINDDVNINTVTIKQGTVTVQHPNKLSPAILNLQGSATLTGDGDISVPSFAWSGGTLSGTGQTDISTTLSLGGTLVLTGRTITLADTGDASWIADGAISGTGTLDIDGHFTRSGTGLLTISGINIRGAGVLEFTEATTTITASYNPNGTTTVSGGQLNLSSTTPGHTVNLSSGQLNLGTSSGSINTLVWSGGTLSGAGTTTVTNTLEFSGILALTNRTLINTGSASWTAEGSLTGSGSATFRNNSGGTLTKSGNGSAVMTLISFSNADTVSVTGGTLALDLSASVHSTGGYSADGSTAGLIFSGDHIFDSGISGTGTVTFNQGTLALNGTYSISGATVLGSSAPQVTFTHLSSPTSGTFTVNSGLLVFNDDNPRTFAASANFSGAGAVEFRAGTLTVDSSYVLSAGGRTKVSGATLDLSNAISIGLGDTLEVTGGTVNLGTKNASISSLIWSGGSLAGAGTTTVTTGLTLSGTLLTLTDRTLAFSSGGLGTWSSAGTLTGSGSAAFNLNGTLTKSGSEAATITSIAFHNNGTVAVSEGTLTVNLPVTPASSGSYSIANAATLNLSGGHTFGGGITGVGSGAVNFTSGAMTINGSYDVAGTTTVSGATVDLSAGSVLNLGTTLTMTTSGSSLNLGTSVGSVATFTWSGGTLAGSGTTTVTTSLALSGNLSLTDRTLNNTGTTTWNDTGTVTGSGNAQFINNTGGIFTWSGSGTASISGAIFSNAGTVNVTAGTLDLALSASRTSSGAYTVEHGAVLRFAGPHTFASGSTFTSAGSIEFYAGAISIYCNYAPLGMTTLSGPSSPVVTIYYPGTTSGIGQFTVSSGTLAFNGNHTFLSGTSISGTGTVQFNGGTLEYNGSYSLDGPTMINGATTSLQINYPDSAAVSGPFTINAGKLTFAIDHGELSFNPSASLNGDGTVEFLSGNFTVDSTYGISGTTVLSSGNLDLSGATITSNLGSVLTIKGGTLNLDGKSITVPTLNWSGGGMSGSGTTSVSGSLTFSNDLILTDRTLSNNGIASWGAAGQLTGTGTFSNLNQLTKSGASTQTNLSTTGFSNSGTIRVASGTLKIDFPASSNSIGVYSADPGARLILSGAHSFIEPSSISGAGTVEFPSGLVTISSTYAVTGTTLVSGATLDLSGSTLTIAGSTLQLSVGSVILGGQTPSISTLTLNDGELSGTDILTTQTLNWSGGIMSGNGTTQVTLSLNISGDLVLTNRTLANSGNASWTGNGSISGTGTLNNTGSLAKSGNGTISTISGITFINGSGGNVGVNSGTLTIGLSASIPSAGTYAVAPGAILNFRGAHIFGTGANISGAGTVDFQEGVVTVNSAYSLSNLTGTTRVSGADVNMAGAATLSLGSNLVISGISLNTGPAILSLTSMSWTAGTISGSGSLAVNTSLSMSGSLTLTDLVLNNFGAASWPTGGTISGTGTFNNFGSMSKSGTTAATRIDLASFSNSGDVNASLGTLEISPASSAYSSGIYSTVDSASIIFSGAHTFTPAARISGSGTIEFKTGLVDFPGNYAISGTTNISGATVNFNPPAVLANLGANLSLSAGALNLNTGLLPAGSPLSLGSLTLSGGTLSGEDSLKITNFNWSSGVLAGTGSTEVSGGILNFSGSDPIIIDRRSLVNKSVATWNRTNGSSYLFFSNNASFTNDLGATFTLQNSGLYVFLGTGTFQNSGNFTKTNPDPVEVSGITFANSGSVAINNGSLQIFFPSATFSTGTYAVTGAAVLSFTGDHVFTAGSKISGDGTLGFTSGAMTVGGTVDVSGTTSISGASVDLSNATLTHLGENLNVSAGSLNLGARGATVSTINLTGGEILGTGVLTTGNLNWSYGSMRGPGSTLVNSTINFNGTTPIILDERTLVNIGTANWNNTGYLYLTNNAVIVNAVGAIMDLNATDTYIIYGTGTLENDGTLNFSHGRIDVTTFRQAAGAIFNLTINGPLPVGDYGQVSTLTADLDGTLHIEFSGIPPEFGNRFVLMNYNPRPSSGFAATQIIDHLSSKSWVWQLNYTETSLELWSSSTVFIPLAVR